MRHLVESHCQDTQTIDLTDGVKIFYSNQNWVLILPDAGEPVVNIYVNSTDIHDGQTWVDQQILEFSEYIDSFCKMQVTLSQDAAILDS
jgi:mannose-1-phosphate guanylyltransferase/phosphomannomutase